MEEDYVNRIYGNNQNKESTRPCTAGEFLSKQVHNRSWKTDNNNIMRNNRNK